jgi:hypothetical protein
MYNIYTVKDITTGGIRRNKKEIEKAINATVKISRCMSGQCNTCTYKFTTTANCARKYEENLKIINDVLTHQLTNE